MVNCLSPEGRHAETYIALPDMQMPSPVPEKILRLARAVRDAGGRALLVGGCVRDRLMGRGVKDWDVEVYGVEPSVLRALPRYRRPRAD